MSLKSLTNLIKRFYKFNLPFSFSLILCEKKENHYVHQKKGIWSIIPHHGFSHV